MLSEKKKHERHRERYSPEIITKRVKSRKRKHKHHRESTIVTSIEPTNNLVNEPPRQGIKLFVSYNNIKNVKIICLPLSCLRLNRYQVLVVLRQHLLSYLLHHLLMNHLKQL